MTGSQAKELELERERGEKVGLQDSIGYAELPTLPHPNDIPESPTASRRSRSRSPSPSGPSRTGQTGKNTSVSWGRRLSRGISGTYKRVPYRHAVVYALVLLCIIAAIVGGYVGYRDDSGKARFFSDDDTDESGIMLSGQLISIDLTTLTASFDWRISASGKYTNDDLLFYNGSDWGYPVVDLEIYADGASTPFGKYIASTAPYNPLQIFSTKVRIQADQRQLAKTPAVASTVRYPLDAYEMLTVFGVRTAPSVTGELGPNASVPIYEANLVGNIQGWTTNTNDSITQYVGPNGLNYPTGRQLAIDLSRADAVVAFAIVIQIVMWGVTLLIVALTIMGTLFARVITPGLFAVPATILFALPTMRNVMPGAPPFGTYMDICGLLLNETIVALCFVALLATHLRRTNFDRFEKVERV